MDPLLPIAGTRLPGETLALGLALDVIQPTSLIRHAIVEPTDSLQPAPSGGSFPGLTIDVGDMTADQGFSLIGPSYMGRFGRAVGGGGDLNGDGIADMIIGAPGSNAAAYVVFGKTSGLEHTDLAHLDGSDGFKVTASASTGYSVDFAGDVNGDGLDDLIVASDSYDYGVGASYVVFGKPSGFAPALDLDHLAGSDGFRITGVQDPRFMTVGAAGDVNGDGYADVVVGGYFDSPHGQFSGASYVLFGKASGFSATESVANLDGVRGFELDGPSTGGWAGISVRTAGDVNGDGFGDLIVGAPFNSVTAGYHEGVSYVVFGKASGFDPKINLGALDGSNGFRLNGVGIYDQTGYASSSAGDFNGDGFDDLLVGASRADVHGQDSGAAYVVFGKASGFAAAVDMADLDGTNGLRILGSNSEALGHSLAAAGDVNGDGLADIVVSGFNQAVYVIYGKASGLPAALDLSHLSAEDGFRVVGHFNSGIDPSGLSVSAADVNGDGLSDIIIGDPGAQQHFDTIGGVYVIYGQGPTTAVDRTGTNASQAILGGAFDDTLSGVGGDDHLFGNGGDDLLAGGQGDDTLDGGAGVDTASYADAAGAVTVDLGLAAQDTGGAGIDTLIDIENLTGSAFGDSLTGGGGDNVLEGGLGDDTLDGGDGFDVASYASAAGPVQVSLLGAGPHDTHGAGLDTLMSIEGLHGSAFGDVLSGNDDANLLDGVAGDDSLAAGKGNDTLAGGLGADTLNGGTGSDTASYAAAGSGVTVDLSNASAQETGGGGVDTLIGVENLLGSAFADLLTGSDGSNELQGGGGDDTLAGGAGNDRLDGGDGVDRVSYAASAAAVVVSLATGRATGDGSDRLVGVEHLTGSGFGDQLTGDSHANWLIGGDGEDVLDGRSGNNTLDGGAGSDTVSYAWSISAVKVDLSLTVGQSITPVQADTLLSIENLLGSSSGDTLAGSAADNRLQGGAGDDVLTGGRGDDTLDGGDGSDRADYSASRSGVVVDLAAGVANGLGSDTLISVENVAGSQAADLLTGSEGDNQLAGGAGDDTLAGGAGRDLLQGGAGIDTASYMSAGAGVTIDLGLHRAQDTGGAGVDILTAIEVLIGSGFADRLTGGASGACTLDGGGGDDTLLLAKGDKRTLLAGGDGVDTVDLSLAQGVHWSVDLSLGRISSGQGMQARLSGVENAIGSASNDKLSGDAADNVLSGEAGKDTLLGGDGADTLVGGLDADRLSGGGGADSFVFLSQDVGSGGADTIVDFSHGEDLIDLTAFGGLIFVDKFDGHGHEVLIAKAAGGNTVLIDIDGDRKADFTIQVHVAEHALAQGDLVV